MTKIATKGPRIRPGIRGSQATRVRPSAPSVGVTTPRGPAAGVIFFNHREQRCGVYQMGRRIGCALRDAHVAAYIEATSIQEAIAAVNARNPAAIIYNWHPSTIPWAPQLVRHLPAIKHIGLMHEISPENPAAGSDGFPYRMVSDPSFVVDDTTLFKSVRHVPRRERSELSNESITVGSFGFAVGGKLFASIVHAVGLEFPGAVVRLRLPHAHFGDDRGDLAAQIAAGCRAVLASGAVTLSRLDIEHGFLAEEDLVDWLAGNDLNVFFYDHNGGRGISSVIDYAIAARRPIAINGSQMFRHINGRIGIYPEKSLRDSLATGSAIEELYNEWSTDQMVRDYQHMFAKLGVPLAV